MPYTTDYDQEADIIRVVVSGELDLPLLQNMAKSVAKTMQETGCKRVLNDLRNATAAQLALDIYNMPAVARDSGIQAQIRRALVVGDKTSEFYFLETMFINRGHIVKIFTNVRAAITWLTRGEDAS
ncbi:MAG: hypothetical protein ISR60_02440 [Anaerolineales bacterium]|nr:hypothetical protein [Anaerolineales bacterium]